MKLIRAIRSISSDLDKATAFGEDTASRTRLWRDLVLFRLIGIVPFRSLNKMRQVHIRPGTTLSYRLNKGDIYAIHEIWFAETYRLPWTAKLRLIIDIGANIGLAGLWLARHYSCARVIAVEPSAANAAVARENFLQNGIEAEVIDAAIGSEDGTATFYEVDSSTNGRLMSTQRNGEKPPTGLTRTVPVRMLSMASLLRTLPADTPVDLVKIDIEGGEEALLSGDTSWLAHVRSLAIEFHPSLVDYDRLQEILRRSGLRRVSQICTNANGGNTLEFFTRD